MVYEKIHLKNSDLSVSRLCFGGCPMGRHGWGYSDRQSFVDAINLANNIGINFFDTADVYGFGEAELTLGEAIKSYREKIIIATKFGVRFKDGKNFYDNTPEWIDEALSHSLSRLQTTYIDLYQIHYRDSTPFSVVMAKLIDLKRKGKIRHIGLSNVSLNNISEIIPYKNELVSFQNEFSLANQTHYDSLIEFSKQLNLTPMTWGSLGQGILTGKYNSTNTTFGKDDRRSKEIYTNFHGIKLKHNLKIVDKMSSISKLINKPLSAIAIRWILDYLPNSIVLAGIKNIEQLYQNSAGLDWSLPIEHFNALKDVSNIYE
jgi:myo-inositol catabolism protein IolS